jgi:hypothetical protein
MKNKACKLLSNWYSQFKPSAKGTEEMSKEVTKNIKQEILDTEVKPSVPLTRYMLGSFIDPVTNEWKLAYIKFNPATLAVGEVKTERCAGDRQVMEERLAIRQIELGLHSAEPVPDDGVLLEKFY